MRFMCLGSGSIRNEFEISQGRDVKQRNEEQDKISDFLFLHMY